MNLRPVKKEEITIQQIESHLESCQRLLDKLKSAVGALPRVDENGHSDCPFAAELYQKKEDAQQQVVACMRKLSEYDQWLQKEIKHCAGNLVIISAQGDRLNNDLPRRDFSDAEVALAATYKKLICLREKVKILIQHCKHAISQASQKQFPGILPDAASPRPGQETPSSSDLAEDQMDETIRKMLRKEPIESKPLPGSMSGINRPLVG